MPTYEILVEDAKKRRASEVEVERKDTQAEKIATEKEEIAANSNYYFNTSKVLIVIAFVSFVTFGIIDTVMGKVTNPLAVTFMAALIVAFLASLFLGIVLFLYSYWIMWF